MIQSAECMSSGKFNCVLAYMTNLAPHYGGQIYSRGGSVVTDQWSVLHTLYTHGAWYALNVLVPGLEAPGLIHYNAGIYVLN